MHCFLTKVAINIFPFNSIEMDQKTIFFFNKREKCIKELILLTDEQYVQEDPEGCSLDEVD